MKKDVLVVVEHDLDVMSDPWRVRYERNHEGEERLVFTTSQTRYSNNFSITGECIEQVLDTLREGRALQGEFVDGEC